MITRLRKSTQLFVWLLAFSGGAATASERAATLRAINLVENPTNHSRPGSRGELGPYQFLPRTWRMHSRVPFRRAIERAQSDAVAVKHYEWIKSGLVAAGIDPNPYNIALAWNCGLAAVTSGRVPVVSYYYAERVQNLVGQTDGTRPAQTEFTRVADASQKAAPLSAPALFVLDTSGAPRFTIASEQSLFEPIVRTERQAPPVSAAADVIPTVRVAALDTPADSTLALSVRFAPRPTLALVR